jgi:hypothetical protein
LWLKSKRERIEREIREKDKVEVKDCTFKPELYSLSYAGNGMNRIQKFKLDQVSNPQPQYLRFSPVKYGKVKGNPNNFEK